MKNTPLASPETARPLAPIAVLMILAVCTHAVLVGCGGAPQESGNQSTTSSAEPAASIEPAPDTGAVADPVAQGKAVYQARCALCHGAEGKGDGAAAAGLNPKPRNHTDGSYMNSQTDEALLAVIHDGKGGMPAWKGVLSEQEMQSVLKYVRTLAK